MIEELTEPTAIIRKSLNTMIFSRHIDYKPNQEMREKWIQSEIFQVLRLGFESTGQIKYGVRLEDSYAQGRVDIIVVNENQDRKYVIEIKRAAERDTLKELPRQLRDAKKSLRPTRSFAFIFAEHEHDLPEHNEKLRKVIEILFDDNLIQRDEDIVIKGPGSIQRY